ncbi:beta-glucan synthesis-associated [Mycena amicta]|nr:beta-glucan synthesis-associated [Mycena amicta]
MQSDRGYFAVSNSSAAQLHAYPPPSPSSASSALSPFRDRSPTQSTTSLASASRANNRLSGGTISDRYHLPADPADWGADFSRPEADDALHDPGPKKSRSGGSGRGNIFTRRGFWNIGCIAVLAVILLGLFLGYPIATHFTKNKASGTSSALVNSTAPAPDPPPKIGNWGLIDLDTPEEFHKIYSYHDPTQEMQLVFSDEFETEGRSFYPGDDPYFEAADLHYWSTGDLEWYDPSAVTTRGGALEINLTQVEDITTNHNMSYRSGMITSWNKFCFTGGLLLANVNLPGTTNVIGLWPAIWTMGNLGRAGYGATLEGMWPYSYDTCDVGTLPNQTLPDGSGPAAALDTGAKGTELSFLPGQRLSRCVCPGESHPGPVHQDGTYVGRSVPEIDMFEAQSQNAKIGQVSQSAQFAPFDAGYAWSNSSDSMTIADPTLSHQNSYAGGVYQQASSVVTTTNQDCYQLKSPCYAVQGFEYLPGYDDAYITWLTDNKVSWTLRASGVGPNALTDIGPRMITQEPMYIIMNLGLSHSFIWDIDFEHLTFPATMRVDWVRVYQSAGSINVGCDTAERPTKAYIDTYIEAYTNWNLTTWVDGYNQTVPKSSLEDGGC